MGNEAIGLNVRRGTKCQVETEELCQFCADGAWHLLGCPTRLCLCVGALPKDQRGSYAGDPEVNPGIFVHKDNRGKIATISLIGNSQQPLCTVPET